MQWIYIEWIFEFVNNLSRMKDVSLLFPILEVQRYPYIYLKNLYTFYLAKEFSTVSITVLIDLKMNNINPLDESDEYQSDAMSLSRFIQIHNSH